MLGKKVQSVKRNIQKDFSKARGSPLLLAGPECVKCSINKCYGMYGGNILVPELGVVKSMCSNCKIGNRHVFFVLSFGKEPYKQTGPAEIGSINPPTSFSYHQTITNRRFKESMRIPYSTGKFFWAVFNT